MRRRIIRACTAFCKTVSSYRSQSKTKAESRDSFHVMAIPKAIAAHFSISFLNRASSTETNCLSRTETVHGVWYDFKGTIERGDGKTLADQSYYILKGTLIEYRTDANKKVTSKSREVVFKSFPREA